MTNLPFVYFSLGTFPSLPFPSPLYLPSLSILLKVGQAFLAYQRFLLGADSALFSQDYMDPSQDSGMPYAPYTNEEDATDTVGTYQQPPAADAFDTETQGYQTQNY